MCLMYFKDLKKSIITIGKRPDCDIYLTEDSPFCQVHHYSSVHFTIKRVKILNYYIYQLR
jgi:hypothetical protein